MAAHNPASVSPRFAGVFGPSQEPPRSEGLTEAIQSAGIDLQHTLLPFHRDHALFQRFVQRLRIWQTMQFQLGQRFIARGDD
jgi:hypothetical protein